MMYLDEIASCIPAVAEAIPITEITIDSRQVKAGSLFIALKGRHFDGHAFIDEAILKGAAAILCERKPIKATIPHLLVPDSLLALGSIAKYYRQKMKGPVIAVTGSNGKTTVKSMLASIFPQPAYATQGNLNNHIGAPLSLLQLKPEHRYAVLELGANHIGEIAYTASLVQPDVALINNIGPAHIGEFGSIDAIAQAKGEIYQSLSAGGIAIVNKDDKYAHFWDNIIKDKIVWFFSQKEKAQVYAENIHFNAQQCPSFTLCLPHSSVSIQLKIPGIHSISNALAAAAAAAAVGITTETIAQGLNSFQGVTGRMTYLPGKNNSLIIDDTYNANLESVLAAIDVLAQQPGYRVLVLGDLGELGSWTQSHHEEIGHRASELGIEAVFTCGEHSQFTSLAFGAAAKHYINQEKLARDLLTNLSKGTTVLVKGSRSAAMEKIVHQLVV